jgi:hypothetical protein
VLLALSIGDGEPPRSPFCSINILHTQTQHQLMNLKTRALDA